MGCRPHRRPRIHAPAGLRPTAQSRWVAQGMGVTHGIPLAVTLTGGRHCPEAAFPAASRITTAPALQPPDDSAGHPFGQDDGCDSFKQRSQFPDSWIVGIRKR